MFLKAGLVTRFLYQLNHSAAPTHARTHATDSPRLSVCPVSPRDTRPNCADSDAF